MSLLSVAGVSKRFGGLQALKDVSFDVEEGSIHGLMGANGAGKTTLFSIIAGNQPPTSGHVLFEGKSLDGLRPDQVCHRGIARTFQIVRPFPTMTVRQNIETGVLFGGGGDASDGPVDVARRVDALLLETGLADDADKPAGSLTLSGRKRLEVARALGTGPRLLLLDEVMAGLTPTEVAEMIATIRDLKTRHALTVLIIEHVVSALIDMSDRITVLHHGERIAEDVPAAIANDPIVLSVYFGEEDEA